MRHMIRRWEKRSLSPMDMAQGDERYSPNEWRAVPVAAGCSSKQARQGAESALASKRRGGQKKRTKDASRLMIGYITHTDLMVTRKGRPRPAGDIVTDFALMLGTLLAGVSDIIIAEGAPAG